MPLDDLPGELIIPQRDDIQEQYLRDVRIRTPGAITIEGTKEYADSLVFADQALPLYYNTKTIGDFVASRNKSGKALDEELALAGLTRLPPAGGSGYVMITGSTGGGTIFAEDEIKDEKTKLRFKCIATNLYLSGSFVPIIGIDTGPNTNLDFGVELTWSTPRPGIGPKAIIVEQADGSGLSGGRNAETDSEALDRLRAHRRDPPASGNDAAYQAAVLKTPGLIVQQAFTISAACGPGSTAITFTLRPGTPGGDRLPSPLQIAQARAWLKGQFPNDDMLYMSTVVGIPVTLGFQATWAEGASNWEDSIQWPPYLTSLMNVAASPAPTATTFRLTNSVGSVPNPRVGQNLAFYDQTNGAFVRKRILSFAVVSAGVSWDIVVDTTNSVSDASYVPIATQPVCPWANSLQDIVTPISSAFDLFGVGEQFDPLPDPGNRQRRSPRSPTLYASSITNRIIQPLFFLPSVEDIELKIPDVPFDVSVGTPGVSVNLFTLGFLAVYPQD